MMREDPWLKEQIFERTLPSGLKAFVIPKPGFQKKFAMFGTHYGSLDSDFRPKSGEARVKVPDGIAHFLEHKLFEEEGGSVADRFSALGASANAYTTYGSTMYLFSATDRYDEALSLLLSFVRKPHFTQENVQKEQGIIDQELRMYMDDPHWRVFSNLLEALYEQHPVRLSIGGTPESIQKITPENLMLCYNTFYTPANMAFIAVGDFEAEKALDDVERQLESFRGSGLPERFYPKEEAAVAKARVEEAMPLYRPLVEMGFKEADPSRAQDLRVEIVSGLLLEVLFGPSSETYNDLYEEGLINDHFGTQYFAGKEFGVTLLGGETEDPDILCERILRAVADVRRKGLPKGALERVRRKNIGDFVSLFDSPEAIAHTFSECTFKGQDLFSFLPTLTDIKEQDLMDRLQEHLVPERLAVSVVRPEQA